jgi:hypothetical protein
MITRRAGWALRMILLAGSLSTCLFAEAVAQDGQSRDVASVREEVAIVIVNPDPDARFRAVKRIALALYSDSSRVNESDVVALTGLLSDPNDLVRHWAALAIAQIGPRASSAIPALERALSEVQCIRASKNSASGIALALRRLGVEPVLLECVSTPDGGLRPRTPEDG